MCMELDIPELPALPPLRRHVRICALAIAQGADPIQAMTAYNVIPSDLQVPGVLAIIERYRARRRIGRIERVEQLTAFLSAIITGPERHAATGKPNIKALMRAGMGCLIAGVTESDAGTTYRFHDALKAAKLLAQLEGWVQDKPEPTTLIQQVLHLHNGELPTAACIEAWNAHTTAARIRQGMADSRERPAITGD